MIEEITSLDEYEAFIKDICSDACYVDPHYLYDSNNLYGAFEKKDQHVYANIYNGSIDGIFVITDFIYRKIYRDDNWFIKV